VGVRVIIGERLRIMAVEMWGRRDFLERGGCVELVGGVWATVSVASKRRKGGWAALEFTILMHITYIGI